jgi:hypothetical protein
MDRHRIITFLSVAILLLTLDLACTYMTFAVMGMPMGYEMNPMFRQWMIQDGWTLAFGKFVLFKLLLFLMAGWLIFFTKSKTFSFIFVQCAISNHLIAIFTHPTLWWISDWQLRSLLLITVGLFSLCCTWLGIRYLRAESPLFPFLAAPLRNQQV